MKLNEYSNYEPIKIAEMWLVDRSMTQQFQFEITSRDAGQRLDEFLASRFATVSKMRLATLIETGRCKVNYETGRAGYRIVIGDQVEMSLDGDVPTAMSAEAIPIERAYEDDHLAVVVKPSGMLVHPTSRVKTGTLANALTYHFNKSRIEAGQWTVDALAASADDGSETDSYVPIRPGLVHRLDRETSGLMVVAKTPRALTVLSRHFRKRLVRKRYVALVSGHVDPETNSIIARIGRDPDLRPHWQVMETGKPAETKVKILKTTAGGTLVELEPVTGRTNQLRIHCAYIGHPIAGDQLYGVSTGIRLCLHATELAFHHPLTGEWMEFSSPVPVEMEV